MPVLKRRSSGYSLLKPINGWLKFRWRLKQIAGGANGTVRPKLYGILLHALRILQNLRRGAAQDDRTDGSNLLSILHDVEQQEPRMVTAALQSLQEGWIGSVWLCIV